MLNFNERFLDRENFYLAFKKVSYFLNQGNEWFDPLALAEYEASLPSHIERLSEELKEGTFRPPPIEPLPFPKRAAEEGKPRLRPYFSIDLDVQLIWAALINVVASSVEDRMPFWSYGNRLYRPVWFEEKDGKKWMEKGPYSNPSPNLYRKWNQSWPLYKRQISLTIKTLAKTVNFEKEEIEDEKELAIYEQSELNGFRDCPYLDKEFFKQGNEKKIFWSSIDLKRFFPSILPEKIMQNLRSCLVKPSGEPRDDCSIILAAAELLLHLPINSEGWTAYDLSAKEGFDLKDNDYYHGIPTGLVAGGFLANLALLDIDSRIHEYIMTKRTIAVFKYVDDHILLSQDREGLKDFLNFYDNLLIEAHPGLVFQHDKTEPSRVWKYQFPGFDFFKTRVKDLEIDVDFPSPLMTDTLRKVSHMANIDFDLLEDSELEDLEVDIRHLLVTDFPATEIRKDTKMSFAAGRLCRLAAEIKPNFSKIDFTLAANDSEILVGAKSSFEAASRTFKADDKRPKPSFSEHNNFSRDAFIRKALRAETITVSKKHKRIFTLLKKTLSDNSDKVKIWKRSIEFCYQTGHQGLQEVLDLIEECDLHIRAKTFLKAYLVQTIQIKLAQAANLLNSEDILFWTEYCLKNFLDHGMQLKIEFKDKELLYPFVRQTLLNFNSSKEFVKNEMLGTGKVLLDQPLPTPGNPPQATHKASSTVYSSRVIWYFISRYTWPGKKDFFSCIIPNLSLDSPISWSILCLFPELIPAEVALKITAFIPGEERALKYPDSEMSNLVYQNGFSYEMLKALKKESLGEFEKISAFYPAIAKSLTERKKGFLTLDNWHETILKQNLKSKSLDPRLGEWTQLEIIIQICELIIKEKEGLSIFNSGWDNLGYNYIHPTNYLIPESWKNSKNMRWTEWQKVIRKKRIMFAPKDTLIDDYRFFPAHRLWENHIVVFFGNPEIPLILGLSILLVKLVSKRLEWPSAANRQVFIDKLFNNIYGVIEQENFSSDLRILLNAVFSKNSFDIFNSYESIAFGQDNITRIEDFAGYLKKIQKKLLDAQWDMTDKEPRQLVYVNLDDLNNSRDKFFDTL